MNKQEIFDAVVRHFKTQVEPSLEYDAHIGLSRCKYRSIDGKKCAAGIFIPDDQYSPTMEGKAFTFVAQRHSLPAFLVDEKDFVERLQLIHDSTRTGARNEGSTLLATGVAKELRHLAASYGLSDREVDW